jgi:1-acyl-sn-glycerol-3-phosphate acyltransferase
MASEQRTIGEAEKIWADMLAEHFRFDVDVFGRENIPEGGVLFCSNHQGYADIPLLFHAVAGKQIGFVAKEELRKMPFFGKWMERVRCLLIKRGSARGAALMVREGVKLLQDGYSLVMFPEGTRSQGPKMNSFQRGTLHLATNSGAPIIPVTISGSYKAFEQKGYISSTKISINFHPPIETKNMGRAEAKNVHEVAEKIVRSGLTL